MGRRTPSSLPRLVLTCEHGGNRIPSKYKRLFSSRAAASALSSHRGYDIGALAVAKKLSGTCDAPLVYSDVSRLLVELNRSVGHPRLFSEFSAALDDAQAAEALRSHYAPHRERVEATLREVLQSNERVLHVAVHSFTPVLSGKVRNAELGLLYDPKRPRESQLARRWQLGLQAELPAARIRRNYPYRGSDDGLTTHLRRRLPATRYLGFEVELNQAVLGNRSGIEAYSAVLAATLKQLSR